MSAKIFQFGEFSKNNGLDQTLETQIQKNPNAHYIEDQQTEEIISSSSKTVGNNQFYIYCIPSQTGKLLDFIDKCDPDLGRRELSIFGLENLKDGLDFSQDYVHQMIKNSKNSLFHKFEDSGDMAYAQQIDVQDPEFTNYLLNQSNTNISQLTSILYSHAIELFFDRYNETFDIESDFKFYTKEQIRYGAIKDNNQTVLQTIHEFPTVDKHNLEYFLQFWEDINFDKNLII